MFQKLLSITQSLRLPSICILCNQFHKSSTAVCSYCSSFIKPLGPACRNCAYPLPDSTYFKCGQCIKNPPSFDTAYIAYRFEEPLRSLLLRFKYHNSLYLGAFLSQLMINAIPQTTMSSQCLIPVPMHPGRLKKRGFNQAVVLTRLLARRLNLPYDLESCTKIINTAPQASLDGKQRQTNLRKAFHTKPLPYQHIILVDDLLTTGSTANEVAKTLKKSGVQQVDIWCCARAVIKN